MPKRLTWLFGTSGESSPSPPAEDHLDPELNIFRIIAADKEASGGTFPSISASPMASSEPATSAGSGGVEMFMTRSDSTEELSGVFPSVNNQPHPISPGDKKSPERQPRAGLPPPAPKSPPLVLNRLLGGRRSPTLTPTNPMSTNMSQGSNKATAPIQPAGVSTASEGSPSTTGTHGDANTSAALATSIPALSAGAAAPSHGGVLGAAGVPDEGTHIIGGETSAIPEQEARARVHTDQVEGSGSIQQPLPALQQQTGSSSDGTAKAGVSTIPTPATQEVSGTVLDGAKDPPAPTSVDGPLDASSVTEQDTQAAKAADMSADSVSAPIARTSRAASTTNNSPPASSTSASQPVQSRNTHSRPPLTAKSAGMGPASFPRRSGAPSNQEADSVKGGTADEPDTASGGGSESRFDSSRVDGQERSGNSSRRSSFTSGKTSAKTTGLLGCFRRGKVGSVQVRNALTDRADGAAPPHGSAGPSSRRNSSKSSSPFPTPSRLISPGREPSADSKDASAPLPPASGKFSILRRRNSGPSKTRQQGKGQPRRSASSLPLSSTANGTREAIQAVQTHTIVVGASLPQEQEAKQATTAKGGQEAKGNGGGVGGGEGQAGGESAAAEEKRADMPGVDEIEPEAVVSSTVSMSGLLECGRAMRMEGKFIGHLVSAGSVTVGPTGMIRGDLKGLKFLRVEGHVVGDVVCDRVVVLREGKVFGDITAVSITVGPEATMRGMMNVVETMGAAHAVETMHAEAKSEGKGEEKEEDDEMPSYVRRQCPEEDGKREIADEKGELQQQAQREYQKREHRAVTESSESEPDEVVICKSEKEQEQEEEKLYNDHLEQLQQEKRRQLEVLHQQALDGVESIASDSDDLPPGLIPMTSSMSQDSMDTSVQEDKRTSDGFYPARDDLGPQLIPLDKPGGDSKMRSPDDRNLWGDGDDEDFEPCPDYAEDAIFEEILDESAVLVTTPVADSDSETDTDSDAFANNADAPQKSNASNVSGAPSTAPGVR